jgi:hypothetical protein
MEDISLHLLDLVQNSITAKATLIHISIREIPDKGQIWVEVQDNGTGMNSCQLQQVSDPFYTTRTTRRVGLGIPMFQASAEATGGRLHIESEPGKGTALRALFISSHIDCLPLGRLEDTLAALIFLNPDVDIVYVHEYCGRQFLMDTRQIREILGEVDIADPTVIQWIKEYIRNGLNEINGGA